MKIERVLLAGIFWTLFAAIGHASEADTNVTELIAKVNGADAAARESAADALRRLDQKALEPLKVTLKDAKDAEAVKRLSELVLYCEEGGPGNEKVTLELKCDKDALNIDDEATFTFAIRNKSDKDYELNLTAMNGTDPLGPFCLSLFFPPKAWANARVTESKESARTVTLKPHTLVVYSLHAKLEKSTVEGRVDLKLESEGGKGFHRLSKPEVKLRVQISDYGKKFMYQSNIVELKLKQ